MPRKSKPRKVKNIIQSVVVNISDLKTKKPRKKRPGVHAKSKTSKLKSSKNYTKTFSSQGR